MDRFSTDLFAETAMLISASIGHSAWGDPHSGPTCVGCEGMSGDDPTECAEELMEGNQIAVRWAWPNGTETKEDVLLQDFLTAKAMVIDLYNITVPRADRFTYEQLRALLRTACFGDYERGIY